MQQSTSKLAEKAFEPLPVGHIRPAGWLLQQLQIQAAGLTGHLDEFWPDIANSGWIGGTAEGWERGPYWLDGLVPLAYLLDSPQLKEKVQRWMDFLLDHQHADGWLGPLHDTTYGYEYDPWPVFVALKALTQYQEATDDPRVIPAIKRFFLRLRDLLTTQPLRVWARMRSADLQLSIYWLYERTHEDWLLELAQIVQQQSYNWLDQFEHFIYTERQNAWQHETHVVNTAMALKQPAVWYRLSHDERHREAINTMLETLDRYHGQVTGVFSGDENLAGKNPSQGTELCAVVEYLFSLATLLGTLGDPVLADRWERIAFNALPAPFKADMWAHQYDQQANQVICASNQDHLYTTNGPDANIFGLEPNFGCCTANMHQGWPKFATHLWMRTRENGLAALSYAPCEIETTIAGVPVRVKVRTNYPFSETIQIDIEAAQAVRFPLLLHIPGWASGAQIKVGDGVEETVQPGTFYRLERDWHQATHISLRLPMHIQTQTRYHNSVALERGPLVFSLKIEEEWKHIRGVLPHADWEVYAKSPWNYGLQMDREHPENSCKVILHESGAVPFSPEGAPVSLIVQGRQVRGWTIEHNAAGPLLISPVTSTEPLRELTLIPYGCTHLRVTEFPVLAEEG